MPKCHRCGGNMKRRKVQLVQEWGEQVYIFRNVPALVCEDCGEKLFEAKVLKQVDRLRESIAENSEHVEVPTINYSDAKEKAA